MTYGRRAPGAGNLRRTWLAAPLLSGLLAAGAPAASAQSAGGDPAYGEYLSTQCVTCHRSGTSEGSIPPIAGLPPEAFVDALLAYKNGERDNQVMRNVTGALGIEEIAALAAYFASIEPN